MTIQPTGRRRGASPVDGAPPAGDAPADLTAADIRGRLVALSRSRALGRRVVRHDGGQGGGQGGGPPGTPDRD
ncbi:hypothetical protein [Nitrospirillum sp. BR 11828]|uniref:hypothetical protein n=1 Tax=Nitrospirillum sp. BR 11828 TaxID=3104325 RepID=UPI002ACA624E|nr:hypothetical protein [Nitrospirillum sp. BR 11828]MDZ5649173.1 hypothetical protein [Nitrospirillum sp. BR 11828]